MYVECLVTMLSVAHRDETEPYADDEEANKDLGLEIVERATRRI